MLCNNRQFYRLSPGSRSPLAARRRGDYIRGCKGAPDTSGLPPTPSPATSHFSDDALLPRASYSGCFFEPLRRCCLGRNYGFKLLADVDGGGSPSAKEAPADTATQRHVLPRDLPNAVKYLTDTELDLLITTSVQEAKRRGRLPASAEPNPTDEPVQKQSPSRHKGQAESTKVSLTRGQVNAVRAALKAGIKPSQIARQFGISQSDVRKVLASDAATQKRTRDCRDS